MYKKLTLYREDESVDIGYWEPKEGPSIVRTFTYWSPQFGATKIKHSGVIGQTLAHVVRNEKACGFVERSGWGWQHMRES